MINIVIQIIMGKNRARRGTASGNGFHWGQLDFFAPMENLKILENGNRHGSVCGVFLSVLIVAIMLAYAANELLIGGTINSFRVTAHTSIVTDYDGSDVEHVLVNERSVIMFGLYDTTLKTFVTELPDYFTYQAIRKTTIGAESLTLE